MKNIIPLISFNFHKSYSALIIYIFVDLFIYLFNLPNHKLIKFILCLENSTITVSYYQQQCNNCRK